MRVEVELGDKKVKETIECDLVVFAVPLPQIQPAITDISTMEKHLISSLQCNTIFTHLIHAHDPKTTNVNQWSPGHMA